jgi:hypothetical protein
MSFFYCHVARGFAKNFYWIHWYCPYGSWNSNANFDKNRGRLYGQTLILPFIQSYPQNPICFLSTVSATPRLSYINPENDHVKVYLYYINGTAAPLENVWLRIGCFGAMQI